MFERLNKVPEVAHTKEDLEAIMEDACELCTGLSEYEHGKLSGLDTLDLVEGLNELDGFDEAVKGQSKVVESPSEVQPGSATCGAPRGDPSGHLRCSDVARVPLDDTVLLIGQALCDLDGRKEHMLVLLNKVPEVAHMKEEQRRGTRHKSR